MDVAAKLTEAQIMRVAIIDDDLSLRITSIDLQVENASAAALLNDRVDPDREAYVALLTREGLNVANVSDLAEPLAEATIRAAAPNRLRLAADGVLKSRADRAEPVQRVIRLLREVGIAAENISVFPSPHLPHDARFDLIIVDYFLVDTMTDATLPFIREALDTHEGEQLPLQVILMSSHEDRLRRDFKTIRPELKVSSSRMRIMEKPRTDTHLVAWRAAIWQLASDRAELTKLERVIRETGGALVSAANTTAHRLWELDLQATDLLHELASKDNDDFVRYVEDAVSRRLLSNLEADGGMRPSLQALDTVLTTHRTQNLLSPTAEIGDSRAAIHGLMHSMEWREGVPAMPPFPNGEPDLDKARWIRKHLRFGMVLRDPAGGEWLNITQACDLAQCDESEFGHSTVLFIRGQHTLPSVAPDGNYYVSMSARMAQSENHVLTWNLRDVRAESILAFSKSYGAGWQVIGELRPDKAQSIVEQFGARMARVGLPKLMSPWKLAGLAMRVADLQGIKDTTELAGLTLAGHAIQRPKAKHHELHLDLPALDELVSKHGTSVDGSIVQFLTGVSVSPGKRIEIGGRAVCIYYATPPKSGGDARKLLDDRFLRDTRSAEKILVLLWSAP